MKEFIKSWIKWYAWVFPILFGIYYQWDTSLNEYFNYIFTRTIFNYIIVIPMFCIYKIYENLDK